MAVVVALAESALDSASKSVSLLLLCPRSGLGLRAGLGLIAVLGVRLLDRVRVGLFIGTCGLFLLGGCGVDVAEDLFTSVVGLDFPWDSATSAPSNENAGLHSLL